LARKPASASATGDDSKPDTVTFLKSILLAILLLLLFVIENYFSFRRSEIPGKTNRPPPQGLADVPAAYIHQLSAYCLAVQRVFGTDKVRAALLWTEGPRLMELPADMLERAKCSLFTAN
jgi:hypothetical protein